MKGVQEEEERSGPTHQDTEQGVTGAATIIASTALQLLPSHPPLETSITQTTDQDTHPIESDPVPPTSREEKSEETITTSNPRLTINIAITETIRRQPQPSAFQMDPRKKSLPIWTRLSLVKYTILNTLYTIFTLSHPNIICHTTKLSYHHLQFLALRQFHLFNRSLAGSCIDAGQWSPASESSIPHHCSCYCDGEKGKETKDSCVRHRKTIQGSCLVFVVILVRCNSFS